MGAAFKVYQELLIKYDALVNDPSKIVIEPKTSLSITLIEGNEYSYNIREPHETILGTMMKLKVQTKEEGVHYDEKGFLYVNDKIFYDLPKSELFINVRIVNDGNIPVDILNIYSNCEAYKTPFTFYSGHVLLENNAVDYPQHLEPGQIFLCQIKHDIDNGLGTTAQFAASLRNVKNEVSNSILIDLLDKNGNRKKLELSSKFSIRPLVDLYATQWQSFQQHDLLELAGIGSR